MMIASAKVPVTVVCGPLGSGKSTLLRYILTQKHGMRIAVIENEFAGSIGVEGMILKDGVDGATVSDFIELANGCVCCSQRDGLVQALQQLIASGRTFDAILVETSGLANPGPVASIFWTDVGENSALILDSIVTVVDAVNFERQMHLAETVGACAEVEDQVGYADVLLLNKVDAVSETELGRVEERLRSTSSAEIYRTSFGALDLNRILSRGFYACGGIGIVPAAKYTAASPTKHIHTPAVESFELQCIKPVYLTAVERWLGSLLWDHEIVSLGAVVRSGPDAISVAPAAEHALLVLRAKGILFGIDDRGIVERGDPVSDGHPCWFLLQAVHELFEVSLLSGAALTGRQQVTDGPASRLVVIGRGMTHSSLQSSFETTSCARFQAL
jgi:G3E family GTPase